MTPSDNPVPVRRPTLLLGVAVVFVLAAGGGGFLYYNAHHPLAERPTDLTVFGAVNLVSKGMTRDEVEAKIGPATAEASWQSGDANQGLRVTYAMPADGAAIEIFYDMQHRCALVERRGKPKIRIQ